MVWVLDSENKKSVYRRGQALLAKGDLDGAQRDLNVAAAAFPNDKGVKDDLKKLAEKFKAITQKVIDIISYHHCTIHAIVILMLHACMIIGACSIRGYL